MAGKLSDDKERISASLEKELVKLGREFARKNEMTLTDVLKISLRNYLDAQKKEPKKGK